MKIGGHTCRNWVQEKPTQAVSLEKGTEVHVAKPQQWTRAGALRVVHHETLQASTIELVA